MCNSFAIHFNVVAEDWFAAVATIHDVIDRAGIFDAQRAGHNPNLANSSVSVNTPDPFMTWRLLSRQRVIKSKPPLRTASRRGPFSPLLFDAKLGL